MRTTCAPLSPWRQIASRRCSLSHNKTLAKPHLTTQHRHARLLEDIIAMLKRRDAAGAATTLLKVRAHIGIDGNEEADKLAKEAGDDEDDATPEVATPEEEHARFGWQTTDADDEEPTQLRDADDVLQAVITARYARIQATQPHSPAARWARSASRDALRGEYSHGFLNAR